MPKTPEYTMNAIKRYKDKFDQVQILLPKGTRDRLREVAINKGYKSLNDYIIELIKNDNIDFL